MRGAAFSFSRPRAMRTGEDRESAKRPVAPFGAWPTARRSPRAACGARPSSARSSACRAPATPGPRRPTSPAPRRTSKERLEQRHLETAMKMVGALGQMKGAAMKLGQFASFIDTEFIPDEYREIYQEQLAKLRTDAPAMPWEKVEKVLEEEYEGEPLSELFAEFEHGGVRRRLDRPGAPGRAARRARGRGEDPVPGDRRGARRRPAQRRHDRPPRPRPRPRPRRQGDRRRAARAGDGGARLRVRGAEPAQLLARLPRPPLHLRAGRDHAALAAPGAGHRAGRGARLRAGQGAAARGAQPLRRDRLPRQLRLDLPPAALQRRPPPRQLHPDGRRPRRLPRLRHDQEAQPRADRARAARPSTPPSTTTRRPSATPCTRSASSRTPRSSTPNG